VRLIRLELAVVLNGDLSLPAGAWIGHLRAGRGSSRHSSRNRAGAEVVQQAYSLLLGLLTGDEEPRGATAR